MTRRFAGWTEQACRSTGPSRPPDLPDRFVRLVAFAYRTGNLSRSVAAKYLERNPGELYYLDWDEDDGGADETGPA